MKNARMQYKRVAVNAVISFRGRNYIKMGNSHAVECCSRGRDAILALNNVVTVRGHSKVCDI